MPSCPGIVFIAILVMSIFDAGHCSTEDREARSLPSAAKGVKALTTLLMGTRKVWTKVPNTQRYVKRGDVDSAVRDFRAIKEGNEIKEFTYKRGKLLIRHVGDRQISLFTGGDRWSKGMPFMEVTGKGLMRVRIDYKFKYHAKKYRSSKRTGFLILLMCCACDAVRSQAWRQGVTALEALLKGAKQVRSRSSNFRKYEKPGNSESAVQEFYSVNPKNIKVLVGQWNQNPRHGKVLVGTVGDKRLILRERGDKYTSERPLLEIVGGWSDKGQYKDRIVYVNGD